MAVSVDALAEKVRPRFAIFERLTYINSCSQGALSDAVRDSYARYLADWDEHGAPWDYWVAQLDAARRSVAELLNAEEDEIAITTSVSAGVDALTSALSFDGERDKIVLSDFEFPTIGPISHAQERRGARVEHVPAVEAVGGDGVLEDDGDLQAANDVVVGIAVDEDPIEDVRQNRLSGS